MRILKKGVFLGRATGGRGGTRVCRGEQSDSRGIREASWRAESGSPQYVCAVRGRTSGYAEESASALGEIRTRDSSHRDSVTI